MLSRHGKKRLTSSFRKVEIGAISDIVIGFHGTNHGDNISFDGTGGIFDHAYSPSGRFHYDADENWGVFPSPGVMDLESIAVHGIGHLLGLHYSSERDVVMHSCLSSGAEKRTLHYDDTRGINELPPIDDVRAKVLSMDSGVVSLVLLLACSLIVSYINGVEGGRRLSRKEDMEFERQLKLLNKPAVMSIKTEYGDIYDCVDFYKQPAFDHPLLKNHTFETSPSSFPKGMKNGASSGAKSLNIGLKGGGCPSGTVPIRRTTKDDLIRAKSFSEKYVGNMGILTKERPGHHYDYLGSNEGKSNKFYGVGGVLSVYNPSVLGFQLSSAHVRIRTEFESIRVGWMVNPTLYGDNLTRLYTQWDAGEAGCYNTRCPGFVVVSSEIPIDLAFQKTSVSGGEQIEMDFLIYKDEKNGNWWLNLGKLSTPIGYWPKSIFNNLACFGDYVSWGGEVVSPPDLPSPPMGAGLVPVDDPRYAAYCRQIIVVNEAHQSVHVDDTKMYGDVPVDYYDINDAGVKGDYWGHYLMYGGPGGFKGD
ncbi:hypothetical protein HHK36_028747 [Tetracentron sinense]|uniref:Neprosin PEP catalytic domain-containing protein n=1 Tax=Tetracentron sinense TaxID=13715 RepID=A0A834YGT3_TETSI|nr:hypothetical protein HHK36_028747 [Tetracentron sinense]